MERSQQRRTDWPPLCRPAVWLISEESPSRAEGLFSTVSNDAGYFVGSVPGLSAPQYAAATPILVVPLPPTSTLDIATVGHPRLAPGRRLQP